MAGLGQVVFLQLKQGAWVCNISDQMHGVQGDIAEVKQQILHVANFQTRMMNKVDQLFTDGAKQSARDSQENKNLLQRINRLEDDEERFLKLLEHCDRLREENKELSQRGESPLEPSHRTSS